MGNIELIVFIRSNPVVSDPRVEKEVRSLTIHGFKVSVLAWDREGRFNKFESFNGRAIYRLRLCTPYNKLVVVAYYPLFWLWVLSKLLKIRPVIIHVCDLDSAFPVLFYRLLRKKTKVIFDVFDTYTLLVQAKSEVLGKLVRPVELLAASRADAFVTVSRERLKFFSGVKLRLTEIIMNCPPDCGSPEFPQGEKNGNVFRIVYAGVIAKHRGLIEVAEAIKDIDDVEFIVAGRVMDSQVAGKLNNYPHVKYVGQLKFDEALMLERSADVIPLLYDLNMPLSKSATPNKLFEAMMLGIPVITNVCQDLVKEIDCGLIVEYSSKSVREQILLLKNDPALSKRKGQNGRFAFEQKYNWFIMEKKLIGLYRQLLADQLLCY
jgi:glycosyltransferase involved in cell wall biosynthesis